MATNHVHTWADGLVRNVTYIFPNEGKAEAFASRVRRHPDIDERQPRVAKTSRGFVIEGFDASVKRYSYLGLRRGEHSAVPTV